MLYRKFHRKDGTGTDLQLLVPKKIRKDVLRHMHQNLLSGHLGTKKTRGRLLQHFYWMGVRWDVDRWVAGCDVCGAIKVPSQGPRAPLGAMPCGAPLDRLATDIFGPLPVTPRKKRYILVVTDYFSKWVEIFPLPDATAQTCADQILNEVIAHFGCPYSLHSDQGFKVLFAELCQLLEIRKTRTSPANPKCNGQTERFNHTIVNMIKAYMKGEQTNWDLNLGCLAAAYRATPHDTTGFMPNLLMLGREVRLPTELLFGSKAEEGDIVTYGQYVDLLRERMQKAHKVARAHLHVKAQRQKERYDAKGNLHQYRPGDYVWYRTHIGQLQVTPKLRVPYSGPFVVLSVLGNANFQIQLNSRGLKKVVHHDRLKPYQGCTRLRWAAAAVAHARRQ